MYTGKFTTALYIMNLHINIISPFSLWHVMTLSLAGFEPPRCGHMCSSARRANHPATGQGPNG